MTTLNLFSNRATAKIAVDVASNDTALTLVPGAGALFPAPTANQYFRLVLQKGTAATDQREYMVCTAVAGDVLTVTRGQEGTPPAAFAVGDEVSMVVTALSATGFVQQLVGKMQGQLEVEADPVTTLGVATKAYVDAGKITDAPSDGKTYGRNMAAWLALGAAAGLAVPIPIASGGTGASTVKGAQTNLGIAATTFDDLAPATPNYGDRWIRPANMVEYVWAPNQGGGGAGTWINPQDAQSEAYPIAVSKGGTGATTAAQALVNLGGTTVGIGVFTAATQAAGRAALGITDYTTTAFKLFDGTVAAPGLAWNSQADLGWLRASSSVIQIAAQGQVVNALDASSSTATGWGLNPRATGQSFVNIANAPYGAANFNILQVGANQTGYFISELLGGTGAAKVLSLNFPAGVQVNSNNFQIAAAANQNVQFGLNHVTQANASDIYGLYNNKAQWMLRLGAGGTANDFQVLRADDSGNLIDSPFGIVRASGLIAFGGAAGVQITGANGLAVPNGPITVNSMSVAYALSVGTTATVTGNFAAATGMGMYWDGGNANYVYLGSANPGAWAWRWTRSTGALSWLNSGGGALVTIDPSGNFFATSAQLTGTYDGTNSLSTVGRITNTRSDAAAFYAPYGGVQVGAGGWAVNATGGGILAAGNIQSSASIVAASDIACQNGAGLGLYVSSGMPRVRFSGDNWRLEWNTSSGNLSYYNNSNAQLFWAQGGAFNCSAKFYQPGGGVVGDNSDERIKENIVDYTSGLEAVLGLRPRMFNYKAETGRDPTITYVGLVAQEAQKPMPELVRIAIEPHRQMGELEFEDMLELDATPLIYALVNSIHTLNQRLSALEHA